MALMKNKTLLVGIDENGYGCIVGPLVVTALGTTVPSSTLKLWQDENFNYKLFEKIKYCNVDIDDSKKIFRSRKDIHKLEHSAICILFSVFKELFHSFSLEKMLKNIWRDRLSEIKEYPWYSEIDKINIPMFSQLWDIIHCVKHFASVLSSYDCDIAFLKCNGCDAIKFNSILSEKKNKSKVLFYLVFELVIKIIEENKSNFEKIVFMIGKQGSRMRYLDLIKEMWNGDVRIIIESKQNSVYQIQRENLLCEINFIKDGERFFNIACASVVGKYIREIHMEQLNRYWAGQIQGIKRTSGYLTITSKKDKRRDAEEFISTIKPKIELLGLELSTIKRER